MTLKKQKNISTHRIYKKNVSEKNIIDCLYENDFHYLKNVIKAKKNDIVLILNGKGFYQKSVITNIEKNKIILEKKSSVIKEQNSKNLRIGFSLLKNIDKNLLIIEKLTEIGVLEIDIIITNNCERRKINLQKIETKAINAMLQSHNFFLPKITLFTTIEEYLKKVNKGFIAHCKKSNKLPLNKIEFIDVNSSFVIGPEGDFTQSEIDTFVNCGFKEISLGQNRLRSETAVLFLASVITSKLS